MAEPYINLIYGWSLAEKLILAGSTGYLGLRQQPDLAHTWLPTTISGYHQSLVAFYTVGKQTTLFYEWYAIMYTNALSNLPLPLHGRWLALPAHAEYPARHSRRLRPERPAGRFLHGNGVIVSVLT